MSKYLKTFVTALIVLTFLAMSAFVVSKTTVHADEHSTYQCHEDNGDWSVVKEKDSDKQGNHSNDFSYDGPKSGNNDGEGDQTPDDNNHNDNNWCKNKDDENNHHYACVENACTKVNGKGQNTCDNQDENACKNNVVDQCLNLSGVQSTVPANMQTNSDKQCSCVAGYHSITTADSTDFTCQADPTITPTIPPSPYNDGLGCASHGCNTETGGGQSGQVLGASTGPTQAVLGLSTTSGEENAMPLIQLFAALTSGLVGFKFLKK